MRPKDVYITPKLNKLVDLNSPDLKLVADLGIIDKIIENASRYKQGK